jgi:hypothetical protein
VDSQILRAATNEVLEAYLFALRQQDFYAADFWRPYVLQRLELMGGDDEDSARVVRVDGDEPEGRGGSFRG